MSNLALQQLLNLHCVQHTTTKLHHRSAEINKLLKMTKNLTRFSESLLVSDHKDLLSQLYLSDTPLNLENSNESLITDVGQSIKQHLLSAFVKFKTIYKKYFDARAIQGRNYIRELNGMCDFYVDYLVHTDNDKLGHLVVNNTIDYVPFLETVEGFVEILINLQDTCSLTTWKPDQVLNNKMMYKTYQMLLRKYLDAYFINPSGSLSMAISPIKLIPRSIRFVGSKWDNTAAVITLKDQLVLLCNKDTEIVLALDRVVTEVNTIVTKLEDPNSTLTEIEQKDLIDRAVRYKMLFDFVAELSVRIVELYSEYKINLDTLVYQIDSYKKRYSL